MSIASEDYEVFTTVGDLQFSTVLNLENEIDPLKICFKKLGRKRSLEFGEESKLRLHELKEKVSDAQEKVGDTLTWECRSCAELYEKDFSADSPYKCAECGARKFTPIAENLPLNYICGSAQISLYLDGGDDGNVVFELRDKNTDKIEIFDDLAGHLNILEEEVEKASNKLEEYLNALDKQKKEEKDHDIDIGKSGVSSNQRNRLLSVKEVFEELSEPEEMNNGEKLDTVEVEELLIELEERGIEREKSEAVINRLKRDGELFEPEQGKITQI